MRGIKRVKIGSRAYSTHAKSLNVNRFVTRCRSRCKKHAGEPLNRMKRSRKKTEICCTARWPHICSPRASVPRKSPATKKYPATRYISRIMGTLAFMTRRQHSAIPRSARDREIALRYYAKCVRCTRNCLQENARVISYM